MTREGLQRDLKALHHGRGVRRPKVSAWIGADLLAVMGGASGRTDAELRSALTRLLARSLQSLPKDLRYLFRVAVGLDSDLPKLEERLAVASRALDRSGRVLRRRLRDAEALLADALLQERPETGNWWDADGWQWLGMCAHLVLREDAVLMLEQEVLALTAQPKFIHQMFTIPGLAADEEPDFEAVTGVELVQVERTGPTGWRASLELPRDMVGGETLGTMLRIRVPRASALEPYLAMAPIRESSAAAVSVDFGEDADGWSSWVLNGVLPSDLGSLASLPIPADAKPTVGRVEVSFERPRVGLAYGIAWRRGPRQ